MASRRAEIGALQPERFGNAQAAAVEQRQHGGVAGVNPRLAAVAGGDIGIGHALGGGDRERPRQGLADFRRAHRGERADLALAVALEKAGEGAQCRRACASASGCRCCPPRRAAMKARTSAGASAASSLQRRRAAEMLGEKGQELQHVAPIGFERLRRHAPLGAEMSRASSRSRPRLWAPRSRVSLCGIFVARACTAGPDISHRLTRFPLSRE